MTSAQRRPRIVEVAFWTWVSASILLVVTGVLIATATAPAIFRGAGAVLTVGGLALAYLAHRARNGRSRLRWAAVVLALTLVLLLILIDLFVTWVLWLLTIILLLIGTYAATRDTASTWFDAAESGRDGG
jgi:hypothetical protein